MFPLLIAAVAAFGVTKGAVDGTLFSGGGEEASPPPPAATPPAEGAAPKEQTVNEAVSRQKAA